MESSQIPKIYCIFCFKLVSPHDHDVDSSVDGEGKKSQVFSEFFELVCSETGSQSMSSMNTGVCDDCFLGVDTFCKVTQLIARLQGQRNWHLEQLQNIMKSASKVPSRVNQFRESFCFEHQDERGELVVTIKQGQMNKVWECREKMMEGCSRSLEKGPAPREGPEEMEEIEEVEIIGEIVKVEVSPNDIQCDAILEESAEEDDVIDLEDACSNSDYCESSSPKRRKLSPSSTSTRKRLPTFLKCTVAQCGKYFPSQPDLDRHSQEHGHFPCNFCDFEATQARILIEHEVQFHSSAGTIPGKVTCPRCSYQLGQAESSKDFQAKHYFREHLEIKGNGVAECPRCGRIFTGFTNGDANKLMKKHLKSHTEIKKFNCEVCGNSMKSKDSLNRHLRSVHGIQI